MDSLGKIIARNRKQHKLKQQDLAEALDKYNIKIKKNAICAWENDISQPNASQIFAVCQVLGITDIYTEFIGTNPDNPLAGLNEKGREKALDYIHLLTLSGEYKKETPMPVSLLVERCLNVYDLPVSAGTGSFLDSDEYEPMTVGSEVPEVADFGVRVSGDSMLPRFLNSQIVWVEKTLELNHGEYGIFYLNGNAFIKKLQNNVDGLALISLNTKYAPIVIREDDDFRIFGRVVG